jgi:hypothetical protein
MWKAIGCRHPDLMIQARMPQCRRRDLGGVVERLMAPVLKTGRAKALVGSNPTPSAGKLTFTSGQLHLFV